eukprot:m.276723 g.276723  ORF g.276723 m.276723 type:complete len:557 (-) comp17701_c0_seq2:2747-4417(-)
MPSPQKRKTRSRSNSTSAVGSSRRSSYHSGALQGLSNSLDSQAFSVLKVTNGKPMKKSKDLARLRQTNNSSPVDSPLSSAQGSFDYLPSPVPFSPSSRHQQQFENRHEDQQHAAELQHALSLASDVTQDGTPPDSAVGQSFFGSCSLAARRMCPAVPFVGQAPELSNPSTSTNDQLLASLDESCLSDGALDVSMGLSRHPPDDDLNDDELNDDELNDDELNDVFSPEFATPARPAAPVPTYSSSTVAVQPQSTTDLPRPVPNLRSGVALTRSASVPNDQGLGMSAVQLLAAGPLRQTNRQGSLEAEPFRAASSESCIGQRYQLPAHFDPAKGAPELVLPTTAKEHVGNNNIRGCYISGQTLADLIDGKYNDHFDQHVILDCRFAFEYSGGSISGALNVWLREHLISTLFGDPIVEISEGKRVAVIFHCEFSAHRGPLQYHFARLVDEEISRSSPHRIFPQMYILEGGYREFHRDFPQYCRDYVTMDNKLFKAQLKEAEHMLHCSELKAKEGEWTTKAAVMHLKQQIVAGKPISQLTSMPARHGAENSPCTPYSQVV